MDAASAVSKPLDQRRLSTATTVASRLSSSSFGSDVIEGLWTSPTPSMHDDDIDIDIDDVLDMHGIFEHAKQQSNTIDHDISTALVRALKQENALLRHDVEKLQDAQDLAKHLRKQVQKLEMELLLRGSESRASLTGLLSSLELRESFRTDRMPTFVSTSSDGYASSDANERISMLGGGDGNGCLYDSEDDAIIACGAGKDRSSRYEDDMEQPEIERECDAYLRDSIFAEKAIDDFALDDDPEDGAAADQDPEPVSDSSACIDRDALARELAHAHAVIAALLAAEPQSQHTVTGRDSQRLGDLDVSEDERQDHTEHFEVDHVAMQNRESAAQQRIDELEAELAHVRALSSCQKALLDAFQHDLVDEAELLLLHTESGRVFSDDRRHPESQQQGPRLLRLLQHERWGRTEVKTLLIALALVCATLFSVSSVLEGVVH